eukprot:11193708-Lingulodinium_polyedra.AAC.1
MPGAAEEQPLWRRSVVVRVGGVRARQALPQGWSRRKKTGIAPRSPMWWMFSGSKFWWRRLAS